MKQNATKVWCIRDTISYFCTIEFVTLLIIQSREMDRYMDGLDSESLLWIGMTDAVFLWLGKTPCEKQRSNSLLSGLASSALHSFKTLAGISSGPLALSGCRFLRSFLNVFSSKSYPFLGVCCWSLNFRSGILCIVELAFGGKGLAEFFSLLFCWCVSLVLIFKHWYVCSSGLSRQGVKSVPPFLATEAAIWEFPFQLQRKTPPLWDYHAIKLQVLCHWL